MFEKENTFISLSCSQKEREGGKKEGKRSLSRAQIFQLADNASYAYFPIIPWPEREWLNVEAEITHTLWTNYRLSHFELKVKSYKVKT